MKILVTGGAGFIASHVTDAYIAAGHDVVVVDNLSTGRRSNINPEAKFYELDLHDPALKQVFDVERPEVVNHHAAQIDVRRSVADPAYDAEVNTLGGIKLLNYCRDYQVRKVIYISSGGAIYGEPSYLPCDEVHPVAPLSPYGASKYSIELYLNIYKQAYGLDYTILRYANVYGPRQNPEGEAGVVAIFTAQMMRGRPVRIFGDGKQERDFIYVADCARGNVLALTQGSGRAFNLGVGIPTTVNEIFSNLQEIIEYPSLPIHEPAKAGEVFRIYLNTNRAQTELGWKAQVSLQEGLQQTVDYFRSKENI